MRLRTAGTAMVVALALSAFAHAQQGSPVVVRADDGRWTAANRASNPADVPPASALFGIIVTDALEPVGNEAAFIAAREEDTGHILAYVDLRTGERFAPPASGR